MTCARLQLLQRLTTATGRPVNRFQHFVVCEKRNKLLGSILGSKEVGGSLTPWSDLCTVACCVLPEVQDLEQT